MINTNLNVNGKIPSTVLKVLCGHANKVCYLFCNAGLLYSYLASFPEYVFPLFICKLQESWRTNNLFYKKKKKINQIHVIDRIFTIFPHNINIRKKVKGT